MAEKNVFFPNVNFQKVRFKKKNKQITTKRLGPTCHSKNQNKYYTIRKTKI